ncbi:MAG: dihydroorotate dehydrogenase family protein [Actinomycetia bacterium]|nr:dihydroorotate dehydrogenase family protein [Actinomycetes bacterium]
MRGRSASGRTSRHPARTAAVDLTTRVGPLELPNPIVAASGTFGYGEELARLCPPSALGAVTVKSLAPFAWDGNPAPRLHMTAAGMINAVGLQGPGIEHWVAHELPRLHATGARVIASIWGRSVDDYARAAEMLQPAHGRIVAVEVNASCPNVEDRSHMFAHSCASVEAVTRAVVAHAGGVPTFVKLSPNVTDLVSIAAATLDAGADGLTLSNTVMGLAIDAERRRPVLGNGGGGLSGPAVKPVALRAVHDVTQAFPGVAVIGTGGVSTGVDAVEMLLAGASAVGVGTATFLDPRATLRVLDELTDWCADHGVTRVADLVGGLEER